MNPASERLLEVARRNAVRFADDPRVVGAVVTGSVARGLADGASDIDTILYLDEPLSDEEFRVIERRAHRSGGGLYGGTAADGFALWEVVDGIKCDFSYTHRAEFEKLCRGMLDDPTPDETTQLVIGGFVDAIPVLGDDWVEGWQKKLSAYPPTLARRQVERNLPITSIWVLERMGVERDDFLLVADTTGRAIRRVLGVLYGINRLYDPGKLKGFAQVAPRLTHTPIDLECRIRRILSAQDRTAVETLSALIDDVHALVEEHLPDVELGDARAFTHRPLRL